MQHWQTHAHKHAQPEKLVKLLEISYTEIIQQENARKLSQNASILNNGLSAGHRINTRVGVEIPTPPLVNCVNFNKFL